MEGYVCQCSGREFKLGIDIYGAPKYTCTKCGRTTYSEIVYYIYMTVIVSRNGSFDECCQKFLREV